MPTGLQIFNDNNVIQIDDSNITVEFVGKYTAKIPPANPDNPHTITGFVEIPVDIRDCIAAYQCSAKCAGMGLSPLGFLSIEGTFNASITVFLFKRVAATASNSGLQVYSESGVLTFSSEQRSLRVAAVASTIINPAAVVGGAATATRINLPTGNWAVIFPTQSTEVVSYQGSVSFSGIWGYQSVVSTGSTWVEVSDQFPYQTHGWPFDGSAKIFDAYPGLVIAVNVAGL